MYYILYIIIIYIYVKVFPKWGIPSRHHGLTYTKSWSSMTTGWFGYCHLRKPPNKISLTWINSARKTIYLWRNLWIWRWILTKNRPQQGIWCFQLCYMYGEGRGEFRSAQTSNSEHLRPVWGTVHGSFCSLEPIQLVCWGRSRFQLGQLPVQAVVSRMGKAGNFDLE